VMHLGVLGTGFWLGHEEYTVILQGLESPVHRPCA